jgi:PKHD-type hydroxylase
MRYWVEFSRSAGPGPAPSGTTTSHLAQFICTPMKFPRMFTADECSAITDLAAAAPPVVAGLTQPIEGYRTNDTHAIAYGDESRWIYERIAQEFVRINAWYRYDIDGLLEGLLYCEYPVGTHFHWHLDCGAHPTATRKISLSLQLSDANDYAGGALEFAVTGELRDARERGTVIAFPSFLQHRVTPVTAGTRRSLVAWAHGPIFR